MDDSGRRLMHVAWILPVCLAAGFGIGRMVRRTPVASPEPAGEATGAPGTRSATADPVGAGDDRVNGLERDRRTLQERLRDLEASLPAERRPATVSARVQEWMGWMKRGREGNAFAADEATRLAGEFGPVAVAALTAELDAPHEPLTDTDFLAAILNCGGPDATAFLESELAGGPSDRRAALAGLLGSEMGIRRLETIPMTDRLARTAESLLSSPVAQDRAAALALLIFVPGSLGTIFKAAREDVAVREISLAGLGRCGDEKALHWLEAELIPTLREEEDPDSFRPLTQAAEDARHRIRRRLRR